MADEHVFKLPADAKEFTQEDSRRKRLAYRSRVEANGSMRIAALTAEEYRAACPGEVTSLRSILSKSTGLACLYQGAGNIPVRTDPGSHSFSFGFASRLAEMEIVIPKGWYALVDAWVETKVEGIDGPCLIIDLHHRDLQEVEEREKKEAAAGEQGPEKK